MPTEIAERVNDLRRVCAEYDIALGAAALQHALRHPAVTSVVVGARSTAELEEDLAWARVDIPDTLWSALDTEVGA